MKPASAKGKPVKAFDLHEALMPFCKFLEQYAPPGRIEIRIPNADTIPCIIEKYGINGEKDEVFRLPGLSIYYPIGEIRFKDSLSGLVEFSERIKIGSRFDDDELIKQKRLFFSGCVASVIPDDWDYSCGDFFNILGIRPGVCDFRVRIWPKNEFDSNGTTSFQFTYSIDELRLNARANAFMRDCVETAKLCKKYIDEQSARAADGEAETNKQKGINMINGYRELTEEETELVNLIKETGDKVGQLLDLVASFPEADKRAVAIAKTEAQTALMWAVRAVTKPEKF